MVKCIFIILPDLHLKHWQRKHFIILLEEPIEPSLLKGCNPWQLIFTCESPLVWQISALLFKSLKWVFLQLKHTHLKNMMKGIIHVMSWKSWKTKSPGTFNIQAAALCNTSKNPVKCWYEAIYGRKKQLWHFTGMKTRQYSETALIVEVKQRAAGSGNLRSSHTQCDTYTQLYIHPAAAHTLPSSLLDVAVTWCNSGLDGSHGCWLVDLMDCHS